MQLEPYRELLRLKSSAGHHRLTSSMHMAAMEAGMIAYQTSLSSRAMLLNSSSGNFFEFIRYEDRDRADGERLGRHDRSQSRLCTSDLKRERPVGVRFGRRGAVL